MVFSLFYPSLEFNAFCCAVRKTLDGAGKIHGSKNEKKGNLVALFGKPHEQMTQGAIAGQAQFAAELKKAPRNAAGLWECRGATPN
jgi:hypothetical protein